MQESSEVPLEDRALFIRQYQLLPHSKIVTPPEEFIIKMVAKINHDVSSHVRGTSGFIDFETHSALGRRGYHWNDIGRFFVRLSDGTNLAPEGYHRMREMVMKATVKRGIHFFSSPDPNFTTHRTLATGLENYITLPDDYDLSLTPAKE